MALEWLKSVGRAIAGFFGFGGSAASTAPTNATSSASANVAAPVAIPVGATTPGPLFTANVVGGTNAIKVVTQLQQQLARPPTLQIGFLDGATYPDGTSVPLIAALNEYGGVIKRPASQITIYRKVNAAGTGFLRNGRFVRRSQSNFASTHAVPAYTITIPPRPFMRTMITKYSKDWGREAGQLLVSNNYDMDRAMHLMGERIKGQLQQTIIEFKSPPNAPSTIARKGFNDPLIDTGHMLNSVDYEII